jgi:glycine C-acetyltransferase
MSKTLVDFLRTEATNLDQAGLLRQERVLGSAQGATVTLDGREAVNLASGDYLGLSTHADVKKAAKAALDAFGVGVASPRMMTGNLSLHDELEKELARWLGSEDAVLYPSGYHADTGLFEALLADRDFVFCDEMLRPSLADGIRLCRAKVFVYRHRDLNHLEDRLKRSRAARFRVIATDGVFPLDGECAPLNEIQALAARYDALLVIDDSHGVGVLGENGRGTLAHLGAATKPHVITATFGNALGGGAGGFIACGREVATWLRQKSRPYLASTALSPASAAAALKAVQVVRSEPQLREDLKANVKLMRDLLAEQGCLVAGREDHPAIPVMIGNAVLCQRMGDLLYKAGVYTIGFCHPVVAEGAARLRVQVTVAHSQKTLKKAADAFGDATRTLKGR